MIPDYEKALAIFPTFYFIVVFLIMSAVYYNRYHSEESDAKATSYFRDYAFIMNSQSMIISSLNGIILILLYNNVAVGITMLLITQALTAYVFVALHLKSHVDSLFFLCFAVLAYVYEFLYFLFADVQANVFGRYLSGLEISILVFIIIIAIISIILATLYVYVGRKESRNAA